MRGSAGCAGVTKVKCANPNLILTLALTLSDVYRRRIRLRDTSACSALEVDNFMRYINLLTYLLTYLLNPNPTNPKMQARIPAGPHFNICLTWATLITLRGNHSESNFRQRPEGTDAAARSPQHEVQEQKHKKTPEPHGRFRFILGSHCPIQLGGRVESRLRRRC